MPRLRQLTHGPPRRGLVALTLAWLVAVAAGLGCLLVYSNTSGAPGHAPRVFPTGTRLALSPDRPTLVVFAHPRCPCSRASLRELDRLVAQTNRGVHAYVVFFRPSGVPSDWARTDSWELAGTIPGVERTIDDGGRITRLFGAETSGHAVLYSRAGELLFSGGITAARAHEGDNRGRDSLRSLVNDGTELGSTTPVFGCPIFGPSRTASL